MSAQHKPGALAIITGVPTGRMNAIDNGITCRLVKFIPSGTWCGENGTRLDCWELAECSRATVAKKFDFWPIDIAAQRNLKVIGGPQIDIGIDTSDTEPLQAEQPEGIAA